MIHDWLTPRQQEIYNFRREGYQDKEIAEMLGVHINTVSLHVAEITRKGHARGYSWRRVMMRDKKCTG